VNSRSFKIDIAGILVDVPKAAGKKPHCPILPISAYQLTTVFVNHMGESMPISAISDPGKGQEHEGKKLQG
jgi:hypothetical protein